LPAGDYFDEIAPNVAHTSERVLNRYPSRSGGVPNQPGVMAAFLQALDRVRGDLPELLE
jgi:hypothetical protein